MQDVLCMSVHSAPLERLEHPFEALLLRVLLLWAGHLHCQCGDVRCFDAAIRAALDGVRQACGLVHLLHLCFDQTYLETLLEKVSAVSRASHRPRNTVGGAHIQPRDDTVEDEDDDDDEDEGEES